MQDDYAKCVWESKWKSRVVQKHIKDSGMPTNVKCYVVCAERARERERRMSARENALLEGNKKRLIEVLVTMKKRIICLKTTPDNEWT